MLMLITGGSGSGKSEYAEKVAVDLRNTSDSFFPEMYYIATMEPHGDEGARRVARHRALREGKGFRTIERYVNLKELKLPSQGVVLLECLSNLTANEIFSPDGVGADMAETEILAGLKALEENSTALMVVTNDIFADGYTYDQDTERYMRILASLNRALAERAADVTEVVCGIPLSVKGKTRP